MIRARAARACCLLLVFAGAFAGCGGEGNDVDEEATVRRFVEAWPEGGSALAETITGADSPRLVPMLGALRTEGVVRATLTETSPATAGAEALDGTAVLRFDDGGRLELHLRATVERDRVVAEPAAVSTRLDDWERLRIEEFGMPRSGRIRSADGTRLTRGASAARPGLAPAVALIRESLARRFAPKPGRRMVAGEPPRVLAESVPTDGEDVKTSLDDAMQRAAEEALGGVPGALVAVDPRTGGIRVLVSNPEPEAPQRSPATAAYSPGSAFKIVTAAAALESGVREPDETVPCPAQTTIDEAQITTFGGRDYGPIAFKKAFAVSCNTAFAQIGVVLGTARLIATAQDLGFRVGESHRPGTIAVPRSRGELGVWSYGAAGSLVSPLQLAGIGATVARGGLSVSPGWTDADAGERVLSEDTAADLVAMMEEVVESGTGRRAAVPGARVAGKTGTADPRRPGAGSDSWFVGLAPSRGARLVAVGFLPGAGLGGGLAASLIQVFLLATADTWR